MHISPINNLNFNGRIRNTQALNKLIKISDKKSLERFNNALSNAEFVNDGIYYMFQEVTDPNVINGYVNTTFTLYKSEKTPLFDEVIKTVNTYIKESEPLESKKSSILDSFSRVLEKIYPKINRTTEEQYIRSIESKLF